MKYFLSCFWIFGSSICFAQNNKVDSLLTILKTTKEDTSKVNILNDLFLKYEFTDDVKATGSLNKALELSQKVDFKKGLATTYIYLGYFSEDKGNYPEALKNYFASLEIYKAIDDKKGIASSLNNIGIIYYDQGNYPEALKKYFSSLKIREAINDNNGIARSYINIGNVYKDQGDYAEALKNYFACLKIIKPVTDGDKKVVAHSYNNIGLVYQHQGNYQEALKNHFASLNIREGMFDKQGVAASYHNIANVYFDEATVEPSPLIRGDKLDHALKNFLESLKIYEVIGDKAGIAVSCSGVGIVFIKQKKYFESEKYLTKSKELSKEIGKKEYLKEIYRSLTNLDSAKGNFKGAYENDKLYILYRDSLDNEETRKKTIQSQMTYDFEKKDAVANAEHKKELENQQALAEEKSRKQKIVIVFVVGGLFLVMVFAGFVFRSLRVTRKQKDVIEQQKNIVEQQKQEVEQQKLLVEDHQKDIIDSITYARRIQRSLLPTESYIEKNLKRLNKRI